MARTNLAEQTSGSIASIATRAKRSRTTNTVAASTDPMQELRLLVQEHRALTKKAGAIKNMTVDKVRRTGDRTGEAMPSYLPDDVKAVFLDAADQAKKRAKQLESSMTRALRQVPVYKLFLERVFGLGPVVSAYLVTEIDPRRGEKISSWRMFCGLACMDDGRMAHPVAGQKNRYNKELRMRIYQMMCAMWKNAAPRAATAAKLPFGQTSKYLDEWYGMWHRGAHDVRFNAAHNTWDGRKGGKALIFNRAMWKAAGVFIEDLYVVWRALEGLPVWPSYYAAKLGYAHGGQKIDVAAMGPKLITLADAVALVGEVGGRALDVRREKVEIVLDEENED